MNFDKISSALLMCFDELKDDTESGELLEIIDTAEDDSQIKEGLTKAIERLKVIRPTVASQIEKDVKGFI